MYCDDWNDYIPYLGGGGVPIDESYNAPAWFNSLSPYIGQQPLKNLYPPYSNPPRIPLPGTKSIFICPSLRPGQQGNLGTDLGNPFFGYQMNRVLTGSLAGCPDNLYKRSIVVYASSTVFMSDSDLSAYPFTDGGFLAGSKPPRHGGGSNFLFVDQHVEWQPYSVYNDGFPAGSGNANSEWVTQRRIYWFPCQTCDKRCP
jgi:prepilin-type processing-associated H-X9-DG protein